MDKKPRPFNINRLVFYLSTYLVPILTLLYIYFPFCRKILLIHMIIIFLIGNIETYFQPVSLNSKIFGWLAHTILIIVILYYNIPKEINKKTIIYSDIICILAPILIYLLPWWKYVLSRNTFFFLFITNYTILRFLCINFLK